jgi:hypothetical protein
VIFVYINVFISSKDGLTNGLYLNVFVCFFFRKQTDLMSSVCVLTVDRLVEFGVNREGFFVEQFAE